MEFSGSFLVTQNFPLKAILASLYCWLFLFSKSDFLVGGIIILSGKLLFYLSTSSLEMAVSTKKIESREKYQYSVKELWKYLKSGFSLHKKASLLSRTPPR